MFSASTQIIMLRFNTLDGVIKKKQIGISSLMSFCFIFHADVSCSGIYGLSYV